MYGKVFSSLWKGSLRGKPSEQLVIIYMIANCDLDGALDVTPGVIADATGLPLDEVLRAIEAFEASDPESRTRDHDGRRLERLDPDRTWGWRLLNYPRYRSLRDEDQRREQNRESQRRYKQRRRASAPISRSKPRSAQAEADGDADAEGCARPLAAVFAVKPSNEVRGRTACHGAKAHLCGRDKGTPSRIAIELPTNAPGKTVSISTTEVVNWTESFPNVEVRIELGKMRAWLEANPKRRKTRGGMRRFIVSWLSREQDRSVSRRPSARAESPEAKANARERALDKDVDTFLIALGRYSVDQVAPLRARVVDRVRSGDVEPIAARRWIERKLGESEVGHSKRLPLPVAAGPRPADDQ